MTLTEPQLFEYLDTNSMYATEFLTCQPVKPSPKALPVSPGRY